MTQLSPTREIEMSKYPVRVTIEFESAREAFDALGLKQPDETWTECERIRATVRDNGKATLDKYDRRYKFALIRRTR